MSQLDRPRDILVYHSKRTCGFGYVSAIYPERHINTSLSETAQSLAMSNIHAHTTRYFEISGKKWLNLPASINPRLSFLI